MHKLFMKLFGWKYVAFQFGQGSIIRRVVTYPSGVKIVDCYGDLYVLDEKAKTVIGRGNTPYVELN